MNIQMGQKVSDGNKPTLPLFHEKAPMTLGSLRFTTVMSRCDPEVNRFLPWSSC